MFLEIRDSLKLILGNDHKIEKFDEQEASDRSDANDSQMPGKAQFIQRLRPHDSKQQRPILQQQLEDDHQIAQQCVFDAKTDDIVPHKIRVRRGGAQWREEQYDSRKRKQQLQRQGG